jgi:hypothetical protein
MGFCEWMYMQTDARRWIDQRRGRVCHGEASHIRQGGTGRPCGGGRIIRTWNEWEETRTECVDENERIYSAGQQKLAPFRCIHPACVVAIPKDAMGGFVMLAWSEIENDMSFCRENMSGESFEGET